LAEYLEGKWESKRRQVAGELFDGRSLRGQPCLCFLGVAKNANLGEVRTGEHREHSHHAKERVAGGQYRTSAEMNFLSDAVNFVRHRSDFSGKGKRRGFAQVKEHIEMVGAAGIILQRAKVINNFAHQNISNALSANELFLCVDDVSDGHVDVRFRFAGEDSPIAYANAVSQVLARV
jgi:hypothetical protein